MNLSRMARLLAVAVITSVVAFAQPQAAAAASDCTTGVYDTAAEAKAGYADDCGRPFESTPEFRCDWVPGGFQCSGPAGNTTPSTPNDPGSPLPRPSLLTVDASARYVSVIWRKTTIPAGFNVYRNGDFIASVNSSGNVYSDFGGREGDSYYVIAYDDRGQFSQRSAERIAVCDTECQDATQLTVLASSTGARAVLTWADNPDAQGQYAIYRDGQLVRIGTDISRYEDSSPGSRTRTYRVDVRMPGVTKRSVSVRLNPDGEVILATQAPTLVAASGTPATRRSSTGGMEQLGNGGTRVPVGGVPDAAIRAQTLARIDRGELVPDPSSRLGAYAATVGYPEGTVGHGAHRAIGALYVTAGTFGEEEIGDFFNSPQAQALLSEPVTSPANRRLAELELGYWETQEGTWGGFFGTKFGVPIRAFIQRFFGGEVPASPLPASNPAGSGSGGDNSLTPASVLGDPLLDPDNDGLSVFSDLDNDNDGIPTWEDTNDRDPSVGRPNTGGNDDDDDDDDYDDPFDRPVNDPDYGCGSGGCP